MQLIRLPAGISVISSVLIAHTIATHGQIIWSSLIINQVASLCLYYGGMILNDCFDYSEDSRHRPERPLPSKKISQNKAWGVGFFLIFIGCFSLSFINQRMMGISLILSFFIILYNSKILPIGLSPIAMGLCRYINWLMALAITPLDLTKLLLPLPIFFYILGLTRLSQSELSSASQACVYELLATLLLSLSLLFFLTEIEGLSFILLIVLAAYYINFILPLLKPHSSSKVQQVVGYLIFGLVPLDAVIGSIFGYWNVSALLLLLVPLPKFIRQKMYVT